jgi:hypothetical protein
MALSDHKAKALFLNALATLGADAGARDTLRIIRVPGSVNSKPGASGRVKFWIQASAAGRPYTYTLDELARRFELSPDLVRAERNALLEAERPAGKRYRAFAAINGRRVREFAILRAMRGGFSEGCRNRAALLHASKGGSMVIVHRQCRALRIGQRELR